MKISFSARRLTAAGDVTEFSGVIELGDVVPQETFDMAVDATFTSVMSAMDGQLTLEHGEDEDFGEDEDDAEPQGFFIK